MAFKRYAHEVERLALVPIRPFENSAQGGQRRVFGIRAHAHQPRVFFLGVRIKVVNRAKAGVAVNSHVYGRDVLQGIAIKTVPEGFGGLYEVFRRAVESCD